MDFEFNIQGFSYTYSSPICVGVSYPVTSFGEQLLIHCVVSQSCSVVVYTDKPSSVVESQLQKYSQATEHTLPDDYMIRQFESDEQLQQDLISLDADIVYIDFSTSYQLSRDTELELVELAQDTDMYSFIFAPDLPDRTLGIVDSIITLETHTDTTDNHYTVLSVPKHRYGTPLEETYKITYNPPLIIDTSYTIS